MSIASEFVTKVVNRLESVGIPYMIVGSVASAHYSQPRTTYDVDIVIDPNEAQLRSLLLLFADWFVSVDAAIAAFRQRSMFNVIHIESGSKADLIFLGPNPFDYSEFERRVHNLVAGTPTWMLTREDAILSKLRWCRLGESERQFRDAFEVALVQWELLDLAYVAFWAAELKVLDLWERVQSEVQKVKAS